MRLYRGNVKRSEQMKDLHTLPFAEFAFPTHLALSLGLVLSYPTWYFVCFVFSEALVAYCMQLKTKNCFLNRHMNHRLWKVLLYCGRKVCFLKMIIFVIFSFKICMKACLLQISGYKQLYLDVESVRKKPYDSDNLQHEKLLIKVSFWHSVLEWHWEINQA